MQYIKKGVMKDLPHPGRGGGVGWGDANMVTMIRC